ncbi:hypothetical protein IID24_05535, partial [Patescibacteria group bacterium]|nr:hypothetical protein [Patescibacteria group bacterium]
IRWVIEDSVNYPGHLLNKDGAWEPETEESYHDDAFIERTRMSQDEAFNTARKFLLLPVN